MPRKLSVLFLSLSLSLSLVSPALAATPLPADMPANIQNLEIVFANVVSVSVALVGIILLFVVISSGFKWASSSGDAKKLQNAQHTLMYALIGFVLLVSSILILRLITQFTGVDVTIFRVVQP